MKILLIDDHLLFLEGLRLVLEQLELDTKLTIFEASSSEQAKSLLLEHGNDFSLALVDLNFPEGDGLEFIATLTTGAIIVPAIVISAEENLVRIKQSLDLGAMGFIPKSLGSVEIKNAIEQVLSGTPYVPAHIRTRLARIGQSSPQSSDSIQIKRIQLGISKRQYDTLVLLAQGYSNRKIAEELHLSVSTIKSHVSMLFQQLGATNRTECLLIAKERGLLIESDVS